MPLGVSRGIHVACILQVGIRRIPGIECLSLAFGDLGWHVLLMTELASFAFYFMCCMMRCWKPVWLITKNVVGSSMPLPSSKCFEASPEPVLESEHAFSTFGESPSDMSMSVSIACDLG